MDMVRLLLFAYLLIYMDCYKLKTINVLVGFECSQIMTEAFLQNKCIAYSCDIKPCEGKRKDLHFCCDVWNVISSRKWSIIVLHPVCTAMAVSGNGTYGTGKEKHHKRIEAIDYTLALWEHAKKFSDVVILENPKSVIFPVLRRRGVFVQYIQPYQFGHPERKQTGLAIHGLKDPFKATNDVELEMLRLPEKESNRIWYAGPTADRAAIRSETFPGVAAAVASQTVKQYRKLYF